MRYPNHYWLMFMTPRPAEIDADTTGKGDVQKDAYAFLIGVVRNAMAKGAFKPEWNDADLLAQVLWAAMHGVVALHLVRRLEHPPTAGSEDKWVDWRPLDATAEAMADALYRGVLREER